MIKKYSLAALEKAINAALALDESMSLKLFALEGKLIELVISPLEVTFFICFRQGKLLLLDSTEATPDTVIHSSPLGLIRLSFLPASKARSLFNDKIRITGDVALGQSIKKIFDEINIDWEGHLAHFTGDVVAYQLGAMFRQGWAFQREIRTSLKHNLTEYLQEEMQWLPTREALQDFFHEVDELALDVERLEAHLTVLMDSYEIN